MEYSSPDFTPFVAKFRSYRRELSETDKVAFMSIEMEKLRDNALMKGLILRMFDYERDRALLETEIFNFPDRMELLFNYIDLFFQLFPTSNDMPIITDEAFNTHAKYLYSLRMYYDKKSSLNPEHSERLIDVFR